jgi:hypothetical protein
MSKGAKESAGGGDNGAMLSSMAEAQDKSSNNNHSPGHNLAPTTGAGKGMGAPIGGSMEGLVPKTANMTVGFEGANIGDMLSHVSGDAMGVNPLDEADKIAPAKLMTASELGEGLSAAQNVGNIEMSGVSLTKQTNFSQGSGLAAVQSVSTDSQGASH